MVAFGLMLHPGAYMRNAWNVLDAVVVASSIVALSMRDSDMAIVRVFRVVRILRPLRMIHRAKGLQRVVLCLVASVRKILSILLMALLAVYIFGVVGVTFFKGRFFSCSDPSRLTEVACTGTFEVQSSPFDLTSRANATRVWSRDALHFDDFPHATLTLFVVSSLEGWVEIYLRAIDSTVEDYGPVENSRPGLALYFVSYIVIGGFFFLNLITALVFVTYTTKAHSEYM